MFEIGDKWRGKAIYDRVGLSNGWVILKTENHKSVNDFKVRTVKSFKPRRSYTPKHAHFAIDFYGKLCSDEAKALNVLKAIIEVWHNVKVEQALLRYDGLTQELPGYSLEYILYALNWILEQEDINFTGRPVKKQQELDIICAKQNVATPPARKGSQLAISLLCDIANGTHPVEALLNANLDVQPRRRGR
jgi:hypothetical protein